MKLKNVLITAMAVFTAISVSANDQNPGVVGVWLGLGEDNNGGVNRNTLTIEKKGDKLTATSEGDNGDVRDLDRVKFDGKTLEASLDFEADGRQGVLGVKAALDDKGVLKGKWYVKDDSGAEIYSGDWKGYRDLKRSILGDWEVSAETNDGANEHRVEFSKSGYLYSGKAKSPEGAIDFNEVAVKRNEVSFELPFGEGTVKVKAAQTGPKKLTGQWTYVDQFGDETGSGKWTAKK